MTSRLANWRGDVANIEVDKLTMPEAVAYLREESGRVDLTGTDAERIAGEIGHLPLALSHAAAYLRDVDNATAESYLAALSQHLKDIPESADYPRAVFATLMENVRQAEARAPGAAAVLSLAAFYAPDDIPEELYRQAVVHYPSALQPVISNAVAIEKAIGALTRLSVMKFRREDHGLSAHRVVQAAARDALGGEQDAWAGAAVAVVNAAFPHVEFANWPICERQVPHARAAARHAGDAVGRPLARLLNHVGYYLGERAAYVEAEPLYQRSLAIFEKALGPDHPLVGNSLNNLAGQYEVQGKYDLAEPPYQRSLTIREKALGPDHPLVGNSLHNLAGLYEAQGKYDLAEPLYQRSLAIREKALGPDHPGTAITMYNLAYLLAFTRRLPDAERLARRAHRAFDHALGAEHPNTNAVASLLMTIEDALRSG
jgi:tetratricopeptide (TPR) repeat protein